MKSEMYYFRKLLLICIAFLLSIESYSQNSIYSLGLYNLASLSGELKGGGLYGILRTESYGLTNDTKTSNYYGGMFMKSSSYIWSPAFLTLDVDGGYYPESLQNQNLIFPNRYDVINTKKLHVGSVLFSGKPITLSGDFNIASSYDSRENLTDIQTNSKSYAGSLNYKNKFLPLSLSIIQSNWDSKELQTGNTYIYNQNNFVGRTTKSFRKRNKNDLLYTHNDNSRKDYHSIAYRNISDNLELDNSYNFDSVGNSRFNSRILGTDQKGVDSFKQLSISENLFYKLPHHLDLNTNYSFIDAIRPLQTIREQMIVGNLTHHLFRSLNTGIDCEYNNSNASDYTSKITRLGFNINYTKSIPLKGLLSLSYSYGWSRIKMESQDVILYQPNEAYTFPDNDFIQLKRPYIIGSTIKIQDATGTIIYQNNIDYWIDSSFKGYTRIWRIVGGQIAKNAQVYLYYNYNQPGNYKYDNIQNSYSANLSLFKNLINFYGNATKMNYVNLVNTMNLNLDYLSNYAYGGRLEYKIISSGVEFIEYESSVYPYKMVRYYFNLHGYMGRKVIYSLNSSYSDNYQLPNGEPDRIYKSVSGMIAYGISRRSKLDLTCAYQNQEGRGIQMDLLMTKLKLTTNFRRLNFVFGADLYNRSYLGDQKTGYLGGYFQVVKKF